MNLINPKNPNDTVEEMTRSQIIEGLQMVENNQFANDLLSKMMRGFSLSDSQYFWANKLARQKLFPTARVGTDLGNSFNRLIDRFNTAKSNGLQRPALTFAGVGNCNRVKIYPAAAHGKNPGFIYVKGDGIYMGKISEDGQFFASRDCATPLKNWLVELAGDPVSVSAMNGRQTGCCCFCARQLTDGRSVSVGYGPICAEKWGLPWGDGDGEDEED